MVVYLWSCHGNTILLDCESDVSQSLIQVRQDKLVGFSNLSRYASKEVAKYAVELLPCLCEHLEATSAFFQVFIAA